MDLKKNPVAAAVENAANPSNPAPAPESNGPGHLGNEQARQAELRTLEAEATLLEGQGASKAEVQVMAAGESEKERKFREAVDCVMMVAEPSFQLMTPNWCANGLGKDELRAWAMGITPALLKYFPDLDEKLPPELIALLVTGQVFLPLRAIPPRLPAPKPDEGREAA